jgi:putative DNA primase/helicase
MTSLENNTKGDDGKVYKSFHTGGEKRGNYFILSNIVNGLPFYVSEGYSSAASPFEAANKPVIVAFDSGNLSTVIENLLKIYPDSKITILADDDRDTFIKEGINPGKDAAEKVSKQYGCNFILPQFPEDFRLTNGKRPTDFNDLHVHFGLEKVKKQLSEKKSYLTTIDLHSFLLKDIPPRNLILDPWLPEQGLTMIFAKRGVGKTFVALSVAYAIACGGKVLKWEASKPRKVLYVDGEMPAATMQERLALIAKASEKEPPDQSYFKLITPDFQDRGIRDLSTLEGQFDINEHISDVDLLVIDNLSTLVRSGRENESESWLPVQEWALGLRKLGKSVLFIHHAGKTGAQRGTSRKEDVLDTVISLRNPKDYSPKDGAKFEIHFEKSRGFDGEAAALLKHV